MTLIIQELPLKSLVDLAALSTSIREYVVPRIDDLVYSKIRHDPEMIWMIPATEKEWIHWYNTADRASTETGSIDVDSFPWLSYVKECTSRSRSMRNRRRVWSICKDIERLANESEMCNYFGDDSNNL